MFLGEYFSNTIMKTQNLKRKIYEKIAENINQQIEKENK